MIKQKTSKLKCRHASEPLAQAHINKVTSVNKSKIINCGVDSDDKGIYSWIEIKEWIDE